MQEIWKEVVGFSGYYRVSNTGKVMNAKTGKLLTPYIDCGYKKVVLSKGALEKKYIKVARLVAEAFVPNPFNYKYVIHKDLDKLNDYAYNLAWCKHNYTAEYYSGKPVLVLNRFGKPLSIHPSITAAAEMYGYSPQLVSRRCITGTPTREGLFFEFFERGQKGEQQDCSYG